MRGCRIVELLGEETPRCQEGGIAKETDGAVSGCPQRIQGEVEIEELPLLSAHGSKRPGTLAAHMGRAVEIRDLVDVRGEEHLQLGIIPDHLD